MSDAIESCTEKLTMYQSKLKLSVRHYVLAKLAIIFIAILNVTLSITFIYAQIPKINTLLTQISMQ